MFDAKSQREKHTLPTAIVKWSERKTDQRNIRTTTGSITIRWVLHFKMYFPFGG